MPPPPFLPRAADIDRAADRLERARGGFDRGQVQHATRADLVHGPGAADQRR